MGAIDTQRTFWHFIFSQLPHRRYEMRVRQRAISSVLFDKSLHQFAATATTTTAAVTGTLKLNDKANMRSQK